jgi:two-component system, sensor histidine kinase and response regulator
MPPPEILMVGSYDFRLVALSVFIAILASYAALDLAGRVTFARGGARLLWLSGGAVAMGIGIWSMHYIGMLSFHLTILTEYDWPTVLVSLMAAIFASGVALFVVSRPKMGMLQAFVGSIFMGGGIAAMHYVGMAAMRLSAMCHYSASLVALSVILAIAISFVAIWLTFHFRGDTTVGGWLKTLSAVVMGAAIPVMHYTGMSAVSFTPTESPAALSHAVSISTLGTASISIVTLMLLGLVILTSLLDRRFTVQALELRSSEQRYRQIVETAFDAFIGMDSTGSITDWNAQAGTTFGWSRNEAIGKDFVQLTVPTHCRDAYERAIRQTLTAGQNSVLNKRFEITALHRDGREFPIEVTMSAVSTGKTDRLAAFMRDVTEQKRGEEEREKAKEAAEAANRSKSEFLANMSHEIRTPLNGIVGMTDLVLDTELSDEQREYLATIKISADSLLGVINDILDFSKIEVGKIDLEAIDFNLRDSLEATLKTLVFRADEKGLELLCEIDPDVSEVVRCDSTRLRQIVVNLVGNAIKFTAQGEVVLKVQTDTEGANHILHFTVADTGIGIPSKQQKLIFEPFTQADSSTTRKFGGTGLGLAISKSLVEMMGGKIWVESDAGPGTRFHFTVRFQTSEKATDAVAIIQPEVLHGVTALIVDDNRTNRRILEGMLKHWGMTPTAVEGGEKALVELCAAQEAGTPYALILTDMHMPAMDGFRLVELIEQKRELCAATIMMLTSADHRDDKERCRTLGIASYLIKPIRKTELLSALLAAIRKNRPAAQPVPTAHQECTMEQPRNLRILLAEDNRVNQTVATRILEKMGHSLVVANNGNDALSLLAKQSFDLVLMDIQMPEMDGLTATHEIREREKRTLSRVPIIAMTAHAMKGDRERCLEAGMDGYVSKPIDKKELEWAIAGAVPQIDVVIIEPSAKPEEENTVANSLLAWDFANSLEGLGGDEQLLREVIGIFLEEIPKHLASLRQAIADGNAEALFRTAHSFKGELGYLGISELSRKAGELEEMGRKSDLEHAAGVFAVFEKEISGIAASMRNVNRVPSRIPLVAKASGA